jgi:hypothetical protein
MENGEETKLTLMVVTLAIATMVSLFAAIAPQQADALSRYETGANDPNPAADVANGKTDQKLQQDDLGNTAHPSPTTPAVPTTNCAMNTIESLESFLSCLGAK